MVLRVILKERLQTSEFFNYRIISKYYFEITDNKILMTLE